MWLKELGECLLIQTEKYHHWLLKRCDKMRIEQVLTNLLIHAYRCGRGLPVEVEIKIKGIYAQILIRDFGIGISQENLDNFFSRFKSAAPAKE
jgi:signal transduction histidine kinase